MNADNYTKTVLKYFYSVTEVTAWIGYITAAIIELVVFIDVCGRYLLNQPLRGGMEIVEQAMTILAGFAIMYAAVKEGHVAIDILLGRFSIQAQRIMRSVFSLLGFGIWVILGYRVFLYALNLLETSQTTQVLGISRAPSLLLFAIGALLSGLTLLAQTLYPARSGETPLEME